MAIKVAKVAKKGGNKGGKGGNKGGKKVAKVAIGLYHKCLQLKVCRFWGITCRFLPYFSYFWLFWGYGMSFFYITL